jgi:hypothetical protein
MTPEQQREELSKAYVAALAARCGFKLGTWSQDGDCLDVTIGAPSVGVGTLARPKLDLQLKSSSDPSHVHNEHISWSLKRAHYDHLRQESHVPILLVVLVLPAESSDWLSHSPEELVMRRCAYWENLRGREPISGNAGSTTLHIPKANLFSPKNLEAMMAKIRRGEAL